MDPVTPEHDLITYRLAIGDGWYRIRLNEHAEADAKAFLDVMFEGIPAEAAEQARALIAAQFAAQIAAARDKRGIDLFIPAPRPHGVPLPAAAILTAEVLIPTPVVPDPVEVVARVAHTKQASRTGVIAGSAAVRIDHTNENDAQPTRSRIEYVIAVPNDPRWLSLDLTVHPTPHFAAEPTIAAFDQAVAALTWA